MNQKRRTSLARRARRVLGAEADIRYVIPAWTSSPTRNWIVAVTSDDFLVFSVDWFFRPLDFERHEPRTVLRTRRAGRKHAVWIGREMYFVPFFHLNEVEAQNREFLTRPNDAP